MLYKCINQFVQRLVLPVVDLRVAKTYTMSVSSLLAAAKDILFRNTKISELNRVLDLSAQRNSDDPSRKYQLIRLRALKVLWHKNCSICSFSHDT